MNRELAMRVADAVLYEGYMLYPYRPSAIKNRQRWSFGILYPPSYPEVRRGTERSAMHSELLLATSGDATLEIELRFLHLIARQVERCIGSGFEAVPSLMVDGRPMESWDEATECSVRCLVALRDGRSQSTGFSFPGSRQVESLRDRNGAVPGRVCRTQEPVRGIVTASLETIAGGSRKMTIDIVNESSLPADAPGREQALLYSLMSAHAIVTVKGGHFVSLLEPPEDLREAAAACQNVGNFPVLVGSAEDRDMMLCSPILLYDYPEIAPESAGDFYDATEMDEMLTLRVMTLTDQEKDEMRFADERARNLLQRTEQNAREQLMKTHGTIRSLRPLERT